MPLFSKNLSKTEAGRPSLPGTKKTFPMKKVPALLFFFFVCLHVGLAQKPITLEDCFVYYKFYPQGAANFSYLQDGVRYVENDESGTVQIPVVANI